MLFNRSKFTNFAVNNICRETSLLVYSFTRLLNNYATHIATGAGNARIAHS